MGRGSNAQGKTVGYVVAILVVSAVVGLSLFIAGGLAGAEDSVVAETASRDDELAPRLHPIIVEHPPGLGVVDTEQRDVNGAVVGIACATCHASGSQPALADDPSVPDGFHGAIELFHGAGQLSCASCHDPEDRTKLRLADGRQLRMDEVMTLCGQCHGSQARDFEHGAHGGARGYWDRTRGPRFRNSCVSCHGAHQPEYPQVFPAPPPNDRFLTSGGHGDSAPPTPSEATHHD